MGRADRIRVRDAFRALLALRDDPQQVQPAFELGAALAGRQPRRLLARVRRSRAGAELLADRPVVDAETCDPGELLRLPRGTFGYEYARWMRDHDLSPAPGDFGPDAEDRDLRYLRRRILESHDFWHVLSGYDCDAVGELGMLAFTYGQSGARGVGLQLLRAVVLDVRRSWSERRRPWSPLIPYLWEAYRHGRKADFLVPVMLEDYLYLPIGSVRQRLHIEAPERCLPGDAPQPVPARG